jgi:hypothetical protein
VLTQLIKAQVGAYFNDELTMPTTVQLLQQAAGCLPWLPWHWMDVQLTCCERVAAPSMQASTEVELSAVYRTALMGRLARPPAAAAGVAHWMEG